MNTTKDSTSVGIVGAGVSGLAAAVSLIDSGIKNITIFEARREAGGRTRSYVDATTGDVIDNGQHLMLGCYSQTLEYIRKIGTADKIVRSRGLSIPFFGLSGNPRKLKISSLLPTPFNLIAGLWWSDLLSINDKFAATTFAHSIRKRKLPHDLDHNMSCRTFFERMKQPSSLVKKLWEPIVLATINASISEASAALFVNVMKEVFFSSQASSDLMIPEAGLSALLIDPAIELLKQSGATIRFGYPITGISSDGRSVSSQDQTEEFDFVIYAAPISDVLPVNVRASFPKTDCSPIVNAYFWIDREVLRSPINGFIGTTLQWAFPKKSEWSPQRIALTVSAANELVERSAEDIRALLWSELRQNIPDMTAAKLLHFQIIKEKRATPLLDYAAQANRPSTMTENSRLLLAGDFVQNGLPATIEGAIRNGFAASKHIVDRCL